MQNNLVIKPLCTQAFYLLHNSAPQGLFCESLCLPKTLSQLFPLTFDRKSSKIVLCSADCIYGQMEGKDGGIYLGLVNKLFPVIFHIE